MAKMEIFKKIGSWLFLLGVLIALISGVIVGFRWYADTEAYIAMILGVLGIVVGILSFFALGQITKDRIPTFLIGALILVFIGASAQTWGFVRNTDVVFFFQQLVTYITFFAAPAAGLLAIRAIWDSGKTKDIERIVPKIT